MRLSESDFSNINRNENGSALLYILFLIALIAIVGSVMLTTVTQGQRNVVKGEGELTHFYKAEGALELIIEDLLANKGNSWSELENHLEGRMDENDQIVLDIEGDQVFINVDKDGSDISYPVIRLTDSIDMNIYRVINFGYGHIIVGDYTFTPEPTPDGPFNDCFIIDGELECSSYPIPAIYPGNFNPIKPIIVIVGTEMEVEFREKVEYVVSEGIYIEPSFTTFQGGSSIKLESGGFIIIDNASFQTNQGNSTINMKAETYFSARGSTIETKVGAGSITLSAGSFLDLNDAIVDVGRVNSSQIDLRADSCVNINGAFFSKSPTITSPKVVGTPRSGSAIVNDSDPNGTCP